MSGQFQPGEIAQIVDPLPAGVLMFYTHNPAGEVVTVLSPLCRVEHCDGDKLFTMDAHKVELPDGVLLWVPPQLLRRRPPPETPSTREQMKGIWVPAHTKQTEKCYG